MISRWFRRGKATAIDGPIDGHPFQLESDHRYDGKPFLKLLDCYVLASIGSLPNDQDQRLSMMAPEIADALGVRGSWFEMVQKQMDFSDDLPLKIKKIWDSGRANAEMRGLSVDPVEFARQFVDTNFLK